MDSKMNKERQFEVLGCVYDLYIKLKEEYNTDEFHLQSAYNDPDIKTTYGFGFEDLQFIEEETFDEFDRQNKVLIDYYYNYCSAVGDEIENFIYMCGNKYMGRSLELWFLKNGEISLYPTGRKE